MARLRYRHMYFLLYIAVCALAIFATDMLVIGNGGIWLGDGSDGRRLADDPHASDPHSSSPTDDDLHGEASSHGSEGGHSLFGVVSSLNMLVGSMSVLIIIVAVQLVEYLFHSLHSITHDTPFEQMINTIEKELMVVGFTAFVFKIIINSYQGMPEDWFIALEYADLLVPIFSFSYCGMGFVLIVMSIKQCALWSRAHHLHLLEVLDTYLDRMGSWTYRFVWAGINPYLAEIEFRVFHQIFCDTFRIQRSAMPFDEYVEKVFEKYVLSIIEIRPLDWFMLVIVILLNLARKELHLNYYECEHTDHHCDDRGSTILFIIIGTVILVSTFVFVLVSRRIELALLSKKGIHHIHEYPQFLLHASEADLKEDAKRLTSQGLKDSAEAVKSQATIVEASTKSNAWLSSSKVSKSKKLQQKLKLGSTREVVRRNSIITSSRSVDKSFVDEVSDRLGIPKSFRASISAPSGKSGRVAPSSHFDAIRAAQAAVSAKMGDLYDHPEHDEEAEHEPHEEGSKHDSNRDSLPDAAAGNDNTVQLFGQPQNTQEGNGGGAYWNTTELISSRLLPDDLVIGPPGESGLDSPNTLRKNYGVKLKPIPSTYLSQEPMVHTELAQEPKTPGAADRDRSDSESSGNNNSNNNAAKVSHTPTGFGVSAASEKVHSVHVHRHVTAETDPLVKPAAEKDDEDDKGTEVMDKAAIEKVVADQKHDHLDSVFLFSNPEIFFEGVQSLMMLISLYYALFLTNFVVAAHSSGWIILALVPGLLSSVLFIYVVKSAALLQSVYSLDNECILEVIDQTEGTHHLCTVMRERITKRLMEMGEPQAELYSLFSDINGGHGDLSEKEFETFMNALEINFTRRKWKQMFREVDRNFDDKISFDEMFSFLFPDHDVYQALEKKRLDLIAVRVRQKVKDLEVQYLRTGGATAQEFHNSHKLSEAPVEGNGEGFNLNLKAKKRPRRNTTTLSPSEKGVGVV